MDSPDLPIVREARLDDAAGIARVHVAGWHETYAGIMTGEDLARITVERRTAFWQRTLGAPTAGFTVWGAVLGGAIVGFASGGASRDPELDTDAELQAIYVLRAAQRLGFGARLTQAVAGRLAAGGARSLYLWVLKDNAPACRFYERLGGTVAAERIETIGSGQYAELAYRWADIARLVGRE